jgi:hypothetical protein
MRTTKRGAASVAFAALCGWVGCAHAGLGEAVASVEQDRAALGADTLTTTAMPLYDRHEFTTAGGTRVHEFAGRDGTVFAVNFSGPTMPDLKAVLGTHYETYLTAARARRHSHHVVSFEADGVVVTIITFQRGFQGTAQVPASVPSGVGAAELGQ